jgi:hypothetical protein
LPGYGAEAIIEDVAQVFCTFDFREGRMKDLGRFYPMVFLFLKDAKRSALGG